MKVENEVICGEAVQYLKAMPSESVNLVITDPPYLIGYKDRSGRTVRNDKVPEAVLPSYSEIFRVLRQSSFCVTFYGRTHIDLFSRAWRDAGFQMVGHIVWAKPYASSTFYTECRHEAAFVLAKGKPRPPKHPVADVLPWTYSGNRAHPTEKAVEVLTPLVQAFSKEDDLILDPFAGSGSTLVAAALSQRRYVGIEIEECYCNHARRRLAGVRQWQAA